MNVRLISFCGVVLLLLAGNSLSPAAGPASGEPASAKPARRKPLPTYYGKIGVSDEQREKLYAVQDLYEVKLERLRKELKETVQERDQKLELLLTQSQQARLKELRDEAKKNAEAKAATKSSEKAEEK
jgi:hypothetical protein